MSRRHARNCRRGERLSTADRNLSTILTILAAQSASVWFDPAWDPGVTLQDDAGTMRLTAMQSRPIPGQTQYTLSQGSLPLAPATATTPNGRRMLSFGGAHYLSGAGALATLLQGSATYSEIQIATRTTVATTARWSCGLVAAAPDNRIWHYVSGTNATVRFRSAAGANTLTSGSTVTNSVAQVHSTTYSSADYDGWLAGASETLSSGGANTRAPASLDLMALGAGLSAGAAGSFFTGSLTGLIITPGQVLSASDRQALEAAFSAYHGYA